MGLRRIGDLSVTNSQEIGEFGGENERAAEGEEVIDDAHKFGEGRVVPAHRVALEDEVTGICRSDRGEGGDEGVAVGFMDGSLEVGRARGNGGEFAGGGG